MSTPLELIEKYAKEVESDTDINVANLREKLEGSANMKHKWLYRLIQGRRAQTELTEKKNDLIQKELGSDVLGLNKAIIKAKVEKSAAVYELNKKIAQQDLLVEYLDGVVNKIFTQIGYDFKNLVELLKMENL